MPHGMCYLWRPGILGLHVTSDSLIAVAYFSIPFTLVYLIRKRPDFRLTGIALCFAMFIVACGSSHLMEIWTIWHPDYWASGAVKAITAIASISTAILLFKLVPFAMRMPSPATLASANAELAREVAERRRAEDVIRHINESLEKRIDERTAELSAANQGLTDEIRQRRQSDELLTRTLASIRDGVIVVNVDGMLTYMNLAAAHLLKCPAEQSAGLHVASLFTLIDPDTGMPENWVDGPPWTGSPLTTEELRLRRRDGSEISIGLSAAPLRNGLESVRGVVLTLRDDTERRRADAIEQRMAALVNSAEDAILVKTLDGIIESWNPGAEHLLGYRADEIIGQSITRLIPEEREKEESLIIERIRNGESVASFETVRRRKDGSLVNVSLRISPVRDRSGAIVGASKIMRDITERKAYVEQLRTLNAELQSLVAARTAQLSERDAMLQEIHHRVKNNLQVISSLISMQSRAIVDSATKIALRQCQSRVETMAQIHEMLYQSADYGSVPFWKYAKMLTTRIVSASGISPDNISISHDMSAVSLPVDKAIPCGLILNELVSNALRHAFPSSRGAIGIELRQVSEDGIVLAVSDDGIGLAPEFDPAKASSLGLQLVVTLTGQLDGRLEIVRQPGTTFRIIFPCGPQTS